MLYFEPENNEEKEEEIEVEASYDEETYLYNCLNSDLPDYF